MNQPCRRSVRRALSLAGFALSLGVMLSAQGTSLRGSVVDRMTGAPLGAVITVLDSVRPARSAYITASPAGAFTLPLSASSMRLVAAFIGYAPETLTVAPGSQRLAIALAPAALALSPVAVSGERSYSAAASKTIRALDIQLRPRESSQDLLRLAPGLVIAQHAGGGKAEQIFLRGFDADHGTDVAISVDETPVNMVSHAHGQGYADVHWLIPEIVDEIAVRKGPYDAQDGDLATAGAVALSTRDRLSRPEIDMRGGSFRTGHALALLPLGAGAGEAGGYLAAAAHFTDGPFEHPQDYGRINVFGKWSAPVGPGAELVATVSGYDARWNGSGQIPDRALASGLITRFGSIDPSEGGNTERYGATLGLRSAAGAADRWAAAAYVTRYRLQLYSDFTFFLDDSVNGDGIEQNDRRWVAGAHGSIERGQAAAGIGGRADFADVRLFHQRQRTRLSTRVSDGISQQQTFAWVRQGFSLSGRLRLQLGLRGDLFRFGVRDRLTGEAATPVAHASGIKWRGIVSPKANLALAATKRTTLFANIGGGFHSNDAREVILAPPGGTVLPRALGAELGIRHSWTGGTVAAALWRMDLASELVYSGDAGTTEASGRTRRYGADVESRVLVTPWLWADLDVNIARGRFRDGPTGRNYIPLAPTLTMAGGLTLRDVGPVTGGMRFRHVQARPAIEDNSVVARGYAVTELFARWRVARVQLSVAVDNLFDTAWNEAQFATTSRLRGEPAPVTELHFAPGAPRALQVGAEYVF
jgi:hypothetical protein